MPADRTPSRGTSMDGAVAGALLEAQRLGFIGSRPVVDAIAHARLFSDLIRSTGHVAGPVVDLGAGGGLPGLVLANDLPEARVVLVDRRRTRTDFLARIVHRLEWTHRVDVLTMDAARPQPAHRHAFQWVVARGFGPPMLTLDTARQWVARPGGILISEPPSGDRWAGVDLGDLARRPTDGRLAWFERS